jgi:hypothetical protein
MLEVVEGSGEVSTLAEAGMDKDVSMEGIVWDSNNVDV